MNKLPVNLVRVPAADMQGFVATAVRSVGLVDDKAQLLAELLTGNDLRGNHSHGTQQVATYARLMRDGKLNPNPQIEVVRQSPTSVMVDGDGGLGYFPAHEGTRRAIDKAKEVGTAVMGTRNHGHFGAAGLYARMTLEHDLICFVTSGHQLSLRPGEPLAKAGGGSPMSFSAPAGAQAALVLDFGAMHDLYRAEMVETVNKVAPGLVLRCIGMGEICQAWGGLLSGLSIDPEQPKWTWPGANQGSLVFVFRIDLFLDPSAFKKEMDGYVRQVRQLRPLDGFNEAYMAGGVEAAKEVEYRRDGIPVGEDHRRSLEELAVELKISVPW